MLITTYRVWRLFSESRRKFQHSVFPSSGFVLYQTYWNDKCLYLRLILSIYKQNVKCSIAQHSHICWRRWWWLNGTWSCWTAGAGAETEDAVQLNQLNTQVMRVVVSDRVQISAHSLTLPPGCPGVDPQQSQPFKQSVNPDCTPGLDAASPVRREHSDKTSPGVCEIVLELKNLRNSWRLSCTPVSFSFPIHSSSHCHSSNCWRAGRQSYKLSSVALFFLQYSHCATAPAVSSVRSYKCSLYKQQTQITEAHLTVIASKYPQFLFPNCKIKSYMQDYKSIQILNFSSCRLDVDSDSANLLNIFLAC